MKDLFDSASSLFSKRFILNAFLPVLIVVSLVLLVISIASGGLERVAALWGSLESVTRITLLGGWLATIWFLAGVLASQFRNLTQLYEGYPLVQSQFCQPICDYFRRVQYLRSLRLLEAGRAEELATQYPATFEEFMPTRLGNILRSAETYGTHRYGLNLPLVWPRLATVAPDRYRADIEEFRTDYEWLLGLSALAAISGVSLGTYTLAARTDWWVFATCFMGGFFIAWAAYAAAVTAAAEYGEQLRVGVDLYRLDVVRSWRLDMPASPLAERELWKKLHAFTRDAEGSLPTRYDAPPGRAPGTLPVVEATRQT